MRGNWFVGLPVPPGDWFPATVGDPPAGVRRFHPDDLHTTVAFLGPVGEERARASFAVAVDRWPAGGPIDAVLGPVVPMGPARRFSALSALLGDATGAVLAGIVASRDAALAIAAARPEDRPPKPHVTLARPARKAGADVRRAALDWAAGLRTEGVAVRVAELALYTWAEDRRQRLFRTVARHAL